MPAAPESRRWLPSDLQTGLDVKPPIEGSGQEIDSPARFEDAELCTSPEGQVGHDGCQQRHPRPAPAGQGDGGRTAG